MKKEIRGFIAGMLLTSIVLIGIPAFAANASNSIKFAVNSVKIALNGRNIPLDNVSYNGSTYVKLSQLCAILGRDISWDGKTRTVNITDVAPSSTSGTSVEVSPQAGINNVDNKKKDNNQKSEPAPEVSKLQVKSIKALEGGNSVEVIYNQKVDKVSAEDTANYSFYYAYGSNADVTVYSATLDSTGMRVTLNTAGQKAATLYTLKISKVKKEAGAYMDDYESTLVGTQSADPVPETGPSKMAPIKIKSIEAVSAVKVKIVFNKSVDSKSAQQAVNYWIYNQNGDRQYVDVAKAELGTSDNSVILTLAKPMADIYYLVDLKNIYDISGNTSVNTTYPLVGQGPRAPNVATIKSLSNNTVEVGFSEEMQKANVEMASNYEITSKEGNNKLSVISAKLDESGNKVILTTGEQQNIEYSVHICNVFSTYTLPLSGGGATVSFQGTAQK